MMKLYYSINLLIICIYLCFYSQTTISANDKSINAIRAFHQTCFKHAQRQKWLNHAYCFRRSDLSSFKEKYLLLQHEFDITPFEKYFGKSLTKNELNNLDVFEFYAAYAGGSFISAQRKNKSVKHLTSKVNSIGEKGGVYYVDNQLTTVVSVNGESKQFTSSQISQFIFEKGEPKAIFTEEFKRKLVLLSNSDKYLRQHPPELWVWKHNFLTLPKYLEHQEYEQLDTKECNKRPCTEQEYDGETYYHAYAISRKNFKKILVGKWSGSDCDNDFSIYKVDRTFKSQFQEDDRIYAWSGRYEFDKYTYIEKGENNGAADQNKEHNEAIIYYVPATGNIIYKGIKSLDMNSKSGYHYYEGPEFYYLKRCL